jgi:hypothetical protein
MCHGLFTSIAKQIPFPFQKIARLESVQSEYVNLLREWDTTTDQENAIQAVMSSDSSFPDKGRNVAHDTDMGVLRPVSDNARIASVSMQTVNRNLARAHAKGFGMGLLKEDSVFDLAKRAAAFDLMDETF